MRVTTDLAVLAVQRSGFPCSSDTLRQWVRRGHIRRYRHGQYDLREILTYLEKRPTPA